ncbi:MAG: hypothetical protein F4Y99_11685 [Acidimicrobiaceae bacterium]|nr:hypothetical protein [Acidimicrobiaceae bacterium]MYF42411.1 hypothetical protein [Acidimicrobiaceae bacterium]MYJ35450.1 hypothetical protein [Acidimicrobiaceae bacterium]
MSGDPTDETPHRDEPGPPTAARRGFMSIMMVAAVVGGALVGGAVFGAIEVVPSIFSSEIDQDDKYDKYDEATRQRHDFGQRVGPDGDTCWPEKRHRQASGYTVVCDLESIGGLHWDTDNVVTHQDHFYIGSGYMCLLRTFSSRPRCWEWSPDVQPRLARAPQDAYLHRFVTADGFACGQSSDYVTCWTVGVDQQTYQQDSHPFPAHSGWLLKDAGEDSFYVEETQEDGTTQGMWLPAFTEEE